MAAALPVADKGWVRIGCRSCKYFLTHDGTGERHELDAEDFTQVPRVCFGTDGRGLIEQQGCEDRLTLALFKKGLYKGRRPGSEQDEYFVSGDGVSSWRRDLLREARAACFPTRCTQARSRLLPR